jgi:hypothetical protein
VSECSGVLVPPIGRGSDSPREEWIRVCYVSLHPEKHFTARQLQMTVDHWWPISQHDIWECTPEERALIHQAHRHCQNCQGGRIATPEQCVERGRARSLDFTPEFHRQAGRAGWTAERRETLQERNKTPEKRAALTSALTGRPVSVETRAKLSAATKAHYARKRAEGDSSVI